MAPARAVQTVLGDFPSGNSPWASWPELTLLGKDGNGGLSWHLFQPVLFCDYPERALYEANRTAVSWSHNWKEKNPNKSHKKINQNQPHQKPTTHPLLKYLLYKGRDINRHIYPQNRMKCPFPLKSPSPSCCQTCKMRNKHRRVLYMTSEDETLNRGFSLS